MSVEIIGTLKLIGMELTKFDSPDYIDWAKFRARTNDTIYKDEINLIVELHAKYFKHKVYRPCTCNPKVYNKWIYDLNEIYNNGQD